jgi:hypothetical protein
MGTDRGKIETDLSIFPATGFLGLGFASASS